MALAGLLCAVDHFVGDVLLLRGPADMPWIAAGAIAAAMGRYRTGKGRRAVCPLTNPTMHQNRVIFDRGLGITARKPAIGPRLTQIALIGQDGAEKFQAFEFRHNRFFSEEMREHSHPSRWALQPLSPAARHLGTGSGIRHEHVAVVLD